MIFKFSSNQFHSGQFSAHGEYEAHIENNIFMCTVTGPLNVEGVVALGKVRSACLSEITYGSAIPTIVFVRNSMLLSPDAFEIYSRNLKLHLTELGTTLLTAYVMPKDIEGSSVMLPLLAKLYDEVGITWEIFEKEEDARNWIQSMICNP